MSSLTVFIVDSTPAGIPPTAVFAPQPDMSMSASIKLAGGVSSKDARALAEDMHCDPEFIQSMRKKKDRTEFACFVRNFTPHAVAVASCFCVFLAQPSSRKPKDEARRATA